MKAAQALQFAGRIGSFCARHFLAIGITVVSTCILWTVIYFALLIWAVLTNSRLGGPLAYPAGLLAFLVTSTAASLLFLFPAAAISECVARYARLPVLIQIPLCLSVLAVLCPAAAALLLALDSQISVTNVATGGGMLFLTFLVPMGLYWWTAQSGPLLLSLLGIRRSVHSLAIRRTIQLTVRPR